ncbi:MAG: class I SAM-dependent methyltransferase [Gammaproteobacteria bacterium]|nr:MAG: class I SAM-dependent methyltransferase [Gammaproteobacteria bacterium]UCH41699.1 MAG: class I SAM-dependent methyltransferase [Gammaproteobacteria bacterium]
MTIGFEHRDGCPVCGSDNIARLCEISYADKRMREFFAAFYQGRAALHLLREESYRVVTCNKCGFLFQDRILDSDGMQDLYRHWVDQASSLNKKKLARAKLFRQYAGQVQTLMQMAGGRPDRIRVLDFGMGWGYWARMAQAHGLDVKGFELSQERREYARGMGLSVITELPAPGNQFDIIYANQVFEHLPDPLATLRQLCSRLAPRGLVYIRVPDGRGVAHTLEQYGWSPGLDAIHPLEHINCFTRVTLTRLGAEAGLRPVSPPLRLNWGSLLGGLMREFADRFVTTHLYFRPRN